MLRVKFARRFYSVSSAAAGAKMTLKGGYWREATSLIMAAKRDGGLQCDPALAHPGKNPAPEESDYSLLMLKRSRKSTFLSDRVVFPGGVLDDEDFQENWRKLFEENTSKPFSELARAFKVSGTRPPFISSREGQNTVTGGHLPPEFAIRIAAIRETFEETGILLVRSKSELSSSAMEASSPMTMHKVPKSVGLRRWRERVRKDPDNFHKLCRDLDVVPNVWALKEWSNWLTPEVETVESPPEKPHRFDTLFYLCCLDEIPKANADKMEVFSPRWSSPQELLRLSKLDTPESIKLIDPQIYELSRMHRFRRLDDLCRFAARRQDVGIHRMDSVLVLCPDGRVHGLQGDSLIPERMDPTKSSLCSSDKTVAQLRKEATSLNRIEWKYKVEGGHPEVSRSDNMYRVRCEIQLDGHPPHSLDVDGASGPGQPVSSQL